MSDWKPRDEVGLRRVGAWFAREIPTLWAFDQRFHDEGGSADYTPAITAETLGTSPLRESCDATWHAFAHDFGGEGLDHWMPELYFHWRESGLLSDGAATTPRASTVALIAFMVARRRLTTHPTPLAIQLVGERLRYLLEHGLELAEAWLGAPVLPEPAVRDCASLMVDLIEEPDALPILANLVRGDWDRPLTIPRALELALPEWAHSPWLQKARSKGTYHYFSELGGLFWRSLELLATRDMLEYEAFRSLATRTNSAIPTYLLSESDRSPGRERLREMMLRLRWDIASSLGPDDDEALEPFEGYKPSGGRYLIRACEIVEGRPADLIPSAPSPFPPRPTGFRYLAGISGLDDGETSEALAAKLAGFSRSTLLCVLPFAEAGQLAVLGALGWTGAARLLRVIERIRTRTFELQYGLHGDVPNCSDPTSGLIDYTEVRRALDEAAESTAREVLARFARAQVGAKNTLFLIEAAAGWNEKDVRKGLRQHGQINLKALGLLPLARGPEEALERYRLFRDIERTCTKWGVERQANTRAAVAAGLANLAQNAGYPDAVRFEWAMESRIAAASTPRLQVGDYSAEMVLNRLEPMIIIRRGNRTLANAPAALKNTPGWDGLKAALAESRQQAARLRVAFERLMVDGASLGPTELRDLQQLPVATAMLTSLVVQDETGAIGLLSDDLASLTGSSGRRTIVGETLRIVHPWAMRAAGHLATWQREIVRRGTVQPFKQVFREVYLATDSEAGATSSHRFAGHELNSRVAGRLLQSRGWEVETSDGVCAFRRFPTRRLRTWFEFPSGDHFLSEDDVVTSGEIFFTPDPPEPECVAVRLRLADVPGCTLSEALRDADLVVSVAREGDDVFSAEAYERRGEAVQVLAEHLGASGVRIEGRFARVQGSRASYRVHLGSGTVFVDPGEALCILPAPGAVTNADVSLPFAEEDERMAEVVAKVVLLANDAEISDPSILDQIARAQR